MQERGETVTTTDLLRTDEGCEIRAQLRITNLERAKTLLRVFHPDKENDHGAL